jgi:hypothetical protein
MQNSFAERRNWIYTPSHQLANWVIVRNGFRRVSIDVRSALCAFGRPSPPAGIPRMPDGEANLSAPVPKTSADRFPARQDAQKLALAQSDT